MTLTKTVRNVTSGGGAVTSNRASPGHSLEYAITYSNPGSKVLSAIVINDATTPTGSLAAAASGVVIFRVTVE